VVLGAGRKAKIQEPIVNWTVRAREQIANSL
jgi:hypothetical protein